MRILIDTNVLVAAFIVHGTCAELFEHCGLRHTLVTSEYILEELQSVLTSKFRYSASDAARVVKIIKIKAELSIPLNVPSAACDDPKDLPILGSAIAGKCQCIITGDKALLKISHYENIDIISPNAFWKYEA